MAQENSIDVARTFAAPTIPRGEHDAIYRLEAAILRLPQVDMPAQHAHCEGLYARTIRIPAGTALTGAVHRSESFFVVRRGSITVSTDEGAVTLHAGDMVVSRAGSKRAGFTHTDCEVTTFHANPSGEQDPAKLWDLFVVPAPARALGATAPLEVA